MPTYTLSADENFWPGRLVDTNRLEFGGLTLEYNHGKNRFYLTDPHDSFRQAIIYESDFPAVVAFLLKRFVPFDTTVQTVQASDEAFGRLCKAVYLLDNILADVRNYTSKHCIDCVNQRDRVDKVREITSMIFYQVEKGLQIEVPELHARSVELKKEARVLQEAVRDFCMKQRSEHRKKGIN